MAESTTSTAAELIPSEIIQESRLAYQKNSTIVSLVRVADLSGVPGKVAQFPVHVAASVTKVGSETTDMTTTTTIDPTEISLTVARRSVRIDISDLLGASSVENVNVVAGAMIGNARIKQVETDVFATMGTAHTSSVGATNNTANTPEQVLSALLTLKNNEANENLVLAIHPNQEFHLLDDITVTSSSQTDQSTQGQEAMNTGGFKNLFGFSVIATPRIGTGTDTNDIYNGIAGNAKAIGYAVKNIGSPIELQRDASKALNEVVMNYYDSAAQLRVAGLVLFKSQTY